ncbi:DMT family transporter [Cohnella terricola]
MPFSRLLSLPNSIAMLGLGMFGSGIAYILFYYLIQKGTPEIATMVTYLIPVSGMIWGAILLQEKIRWSLLMGLALILCGVFLSSTGRRFEVRAFKPFTEEKAEIK